MHHILKYSYNLSTMSTNAPIPDSFSPLSPTCVSYWSGIELIVSFRPAVSIASSTSSLLALSLPYCIL
uniref:Uncharacterized protein n=1 Tax=Amphimedon queenslandica TaxID=400682 RepID=A0A1X7UZ68_AMPQE